MLHRYMEKNYQYKMTYFRFPKGSLARIRWRWHRSWATRVSLELCLCRLGYPKCGGTGSGAAKVTESTHPGAIFLLHAVSPTNAEILGQAIDSIRSQGYTFTTAL